MSHKSVSLLAVASFAAAAECVCSCFIPTLAIGSLDASVLLLNVVGAFLEGWAQTGQSNSPSLAVQQVCDQLRRGFLAVLTSFAFMVAHGMEQSRKGSHSADGIAYILFSLVAGVAAYLFGRNLNHHPAALRRLPATASVLVVATVVLSAVLPHGFVHDSHDPNFLAQTRYPFFDAAVLLLGLVFAVCGALVGNSLGDLFKPIFGLQLGTILCNVIACAMAAFANTFLARASHPIFLLILGKFIGSFCGAVSAFPGAVADAGEHWIKRNYVLAVLNVFANVLLSAFVILLFQ